MSDPPLSPEDREIIDFIEAQGESVPLAGPKWWDNHRYPLSHELLLHLPATDFKQWVSFIKLLLPPLRSFLTDHPLTGFTTSDALREFHNFTLLPWPGQSLPKYTLYDPNHPAHIPYAHFILKTFLRFHQFQTDHPRQSECLKINLNITRLQQRLEGDDR